MRIGKVIGTVTLSRWHPSMTGATYKLVVPQSLADLAGEPRKPAEEITVLDELGAGLGHLVAISEGREAAQPFHPNEKPIDAYNAAILDAVRISITDLDEHRHTNTR